MHGEYVTLGKKCSHVHTLPGHSMRMLTLVDSLQLQWKMPAGMYFQDEGTVMHIYYRHTSTSAAMAASACISASLLLRAAIGPDRCCDSAQRRLR